VNENKPTPNDERIDEILKAHFEKRASEVDADAILAGAKRKLRAARIARLPEVTLAVAWRAAAACILIIAGLTIYRSVRMPSAEAAVRGAIETMQQAVDRCYRIIYTPSDEAREGHPLLFYGREARMWVRGDKFCIAAQRLNGTYYWGSEGRKSGIWLVTPRLGRGLGMRIQQPKDVDAFAAGYDIRSMQMDVLLNALEPYFNLRTVGIEALPEAGGAKCIHVSATRKRDAPSGSADRIELWVDRSTKVVRKLISHLSRRGYDLGNVTMLLIETKPMDDSWYTLEGHMGEHTQIFDKSQAQLRLRVLREMLKKRRRLGTPRK